MLGLVFISVLCDQKSLVIKSFSMVSLEQWIAAIGYCAYYAVLCKSCKTMNNNCKHCVCVCYHKMFKVTENNVKLDAISARVQHFRLYY